MQVREQLSDVEKQVAEMDGLSETAVSEYAKLRQVTSDCFVDAPKCPLLGFALKTFAGRLLCIWSSHSSTQHRLARPDVHMRRQAAHAIVCRCIRR